MAETHFLRFTIAHQKDDLIFEVRKRESDRLQERLNNLTDPKSEFFWFNSIDGLSVILNMGDVQAVRFLWDAVAAAPDFRRSESRIEIQLRGRSNILEEYTEDPDRLFDLFTNLQHGPDVVAFPQFLDVDGEQLQLNAAEVVWITAPTHLLDEGERLVQDEL